MIGSANNATISAQLESPDDNFNPTAARQTKTASGSRTQKNTTSYSLNAARNAALIQANEHDEVALPQMASAQRQPNMSQAMNLAQQPPGFQSNTSTANKLLQGSRSQSKSHKSSTFYY